NGRALNWATLDAGVTYLGEYTVTEGDLDQLVALDLLGITLSDVAGNISNSVDGNLTKGIDANTPVIVDVESVATGGSVMIVGDQITFTVDVVIPDGGLTVNPASFNGENLNWSTSDGGDTYVGIYTVTEGNTNQSSPIKITGITLTDAAGNESASEDGSDISKSIDANTPGISTVTVTESLGTILLVDSIIEFTVTLSTAAETGLTVSPSTYNGRALNWATPDAGVTYLGEYTVTEGDLDQLVALDLLGITLSDAAGNISNSIDGNVTKGIDANTPAITGILASTSVGGSNLTVDDEVDFELTVTDPEYGLTVSPISFNGGSLIWSTLDGATYTSTYTVAEGHAELGSVQLTGVTLSDEAGNESSTSNSNILSNDIDSKFPVISSVILKNKSKIIGDKDTLYININSDTDYSNYTFVSGTVAGYNISSIENFDNTTIYAFFDITEKTYNIDSSATVQVSNLQLSDGAGNLTNIINAAVVNDNHAIFSKKPLANISGSELICHQDSIEVPIFLNGYAPYTITYTDGFTPVTINSIASSLYKLKIFADESIGNPLTYTITDVTDATGNSNSGDGSFTLTINSLPIASFTNPTNGNNFDISQDTVDLVGNFTPEGTFFGDGVLTATEQFSPSIAGLGSHDLTYAYEDANGCNNSETITVEVIAGGNITFTQGKTVYCSYTDTFSVAGFNNFGTPGSFTFDGPIEAIENLAVDTAIIHPDSLIAGNSYNITYSYAGGTNIIRSFSVEEEVSATFDLIGAHCADYETIEIEAKNLSPSGGTGNYILSDGGVDLHPTNNNNDISINPGDLTPNGALPKSYTLEYYYITQNGCSSDTTEKGFIINPLPVVSFTNTDSVYNIDQGSSIITGLPADAGGRFTSTLESIDDNLDGTAEIDPDIVDLGNQWIKYTYTDANGCLNADTLSVKVNQPLGAISNSSGDFQFCTDGLIETFIGTPNPTDGSPGRFYIDGVPKTTVDNRMSFNPQDYRISVNNEYELKFEYDSATTTYEVYETINIDSIGDISFTGLDLAYCEDEDVDEELTPSTPTGFGGNVNFSGNSITYNVVENLANFNPYVADTGVHVITYTFTRDYSGCQQTFTDTTTVNKTPYVDFDLDKFCVTDKTDSVLFTSDDSTLVSDNVVDWFWRINNSETIRESNVDSSKFSLVPQNNNFASLTLTTDKGCTSFKEKLIFIGSKVDLDFEWDNECDKKTVTFSVTERTDTIGVDRVSWDFGDSFGTVIDTTDNYKPQFGYSGSGGYNVVYNEYTKTCGLISKSKPIVIRPSITIENDGYFEDLEKHPDITGWAVDIIESTSDYSWEWGTPNDSIISSAAGGSLNAFVTNLDDNYKDNEKSYVSSPCFDFSALQKPMISFDFIAELEDGYDGVNLQYSIEKDEWIAVGEINQGVNWYNNSSISALDNRSGWTSTGTDNPLDPTDWRKAKFWIDKLGGKLGVRFRFALKTNGSNSNNNSLEGFGFDNIWIGERNRLVLLEHFANPADVDFESTQAILKNVAEENPRDVIPIQFFTSFPSTSEISNFYTAGPSARSLYYGISQVPYSIIDGGDRKFNYSSTNTLKSTDIQKRMLEDSKFEVKVKQGINGSNLNVQATIRAIDVLEESKLSIRAVIVEKSVDSYMNVVRAMLPDPAGVLFDRSWKKNDSINIFQSWEIPEGVTVDSLITIVYIQNEDSKEIYQTGYTDSFSDDVTSINEDFNNILDIEYVVYPNPTDDILNVKLYKSLTYDLDINIYNNIGALVKSEKLFDGNIQKEININDLPLGIYYLKLGNTDKLFGTKKIIKSN
ncbi:MAG: T9SS type A sorting domain-containing protein, partial [Bacteroidales bacterium]|nr:T9SS type A sorting domain-containing protein [Bacteroidales bacterium]